MVAGDALESLPVLALRGRARFDIGVERQAMPLLTDNLARNITSMLVDGTW